jgi:endonuclease/exonuclease/phosphatase family metal-dependent hydrolase
VKWLACTESRLQITTPASRWQFGFRATHPNRPPGPLTGKKNGFMMSLRSFLLLLAFGCCSAGNASGQAARILLDGAFEDWAAVTSAHLDASADVGAGVDFQRFWVTNDEQYLFLRFDLGIETLIQESNQLVLYLDTDADASTGQPFHGIGAELIWSFGERSGVFSAGGTSRAIGHAPVRIVTAPTVSSTEFEIAFRLDARPDGTNPLFPGTDLRIVLQDQGSGDLLPDAAGGVAAQVWDASALPQFLELALEKALPEDVRFLSYNIERDGVFAGEKSAAFSRLIKAIEPDIIGFQEIQNHSAAETESLVRAALGTGGTWFSRRVNPDLVLVSRYPILAQASIPGGNGGDANAAFLLDLTSVWGAHVLLIDAHPPCCRNDIQRQLDFDAIMGFVRDSRSGAGPFDLPEDSPIVILGDMNMVGDARQLSTLVNGDIVNTSQWGPPFAPDWDDTALADLSPRHVALPMTYTWYNDDSAFHPGRLDFMVYSDSVLEPGTGFVLFTPAMSADALAAHGLQPGDATLASDHLPVVADFRLKASLGTASEQPSHPSDVSLLPGFPNPARGLITIQFSTREGGHVRLVLTDLLGREVRVLIDGQKPAGQHAAAADLTGLRSGVYIYTLQAKGAHISRSVTLIR